MPPTFANGYALLIGVTENQVARWALPDVAQDIAALAGVLKHPERCAYLAENVKLVAGPEATRQGILDGLGWLEEHLQADPSGNATAVIYYTGHGWRDTATDSPTYYLIPYDVRESAIQARSLRADDLAAEIAALNPQRLLVVLDCCHAAGMGVKELAPAAGFASTALPARLLMTSTKAVAAIAGGKGLEQLAQGSGRAVLSSSQGDQPSYIRRDRKMSIFTYHLIEALTGHAQPAAGATEVLVSDVMSHVWRRVPQSAQTDWGADQQPDYQVSGNFPVALLLGGKGLGRGMTAPDPLAAPVAPAPGGDQIIATGPVATRGSAVSTGSGAAVAGDGNIVITGKVGRNVNINQGRLPADQDD